MAKQLFCLEPVLSPDKQQYLEVEHVFAGVIFFFWTVSCENNLYVVHA